MSLDTQQKCDGKRLLSKRKPGGFALPRATETTVFYEFVDPQNEVCSCVDDRDRSATNLLAPCML